MNRFLTTVTLTIACVFLLAACGQDEPETIIKEVPVEVVVEKEVVREVPVEVVVEKEVIKTLEVPVEKIVTQEVIKRVQVPSETVVVTKEVVKEVEVIKELPVEVVVERVVVVGAPPLATAAPAQPQAGARGLPPAGPAGSAGLPSATTFQDYQRVQVRVGGGGLGVNLQPRYGPHLVPPGPQLGPVGLRGGAGLGSGRGVDQRLQLQLRFGRCGRTASASPPTSSCIPWTAASTWRASPSRPPRCRTTRPST